MNLLSGCVVMLSHRTLKSSTFFKRATLALKMPERFHTCASVLPQKQTFLDFDPLCCNSNFSIFIYTLFSLFSIYLAPHFFTIAPPLWQKEVECSAALTHTSSFSRPAQQGQERSRLGFIFLQLDLYSCQRWHEVRGQEWSSWLKRLASC